VGTADVQSLARAVDVQRGGAHLIDAIAPEWRTLCEGGPSNEPFFRPEWIAAWLRAFEPDAEIVLVTAYSGGRLQAVLPLLLRRTLFCGIPVRKLCAPANVFSCRFDVVRAAGVEGDTAVAALWRALRGLREWDVIELPDVPNGGAAELLMDVASKDGYPTGQWPSIRSPYVRLEGVADSTAIPRNAQFRQNLRRRMRKANAQFGVSLTRIDGADPSALQQFYELESSGWKGRQGTDIAGWAATRIFHDEIARAAAEFGYWSLYLLKFGETAVAGHYGLTYGGRYYIPKVAYDENYAVHGPGHLIVSAVLQDCLDRGIAEFDFLGPWMEWKAEWTQEARAHSHCYIFRRGISGQALRTAKLDVMAGLRNVARRPAIAALRKTVRCWMFRR
jgi:CelD/BcsL family acetyltransferase involved in cellulose biosynthesis